jgi:hypothetical protein
MSNYADYPYQTGVTGRRGYVQLELATTSPRRNAMSISSHVEELKRKHEQLDHQVEELARAPGVDGLRLASLKKQKLKLKEEIERLSH